MGEKLPPVLSGHSAFLETGLDYVWVGRESELWQHDDVVSQHLKNWCFNLEKVIIPR